MTSKFELIELKSDTGKDYFIQGYVSTPKPDFKRDIVDDEGQKSVYREITGKDITIDEDHEEYRDPESGQLYDGKKHKYPVAKVVEAKLDDKGTWVKAKLNKYHPHYERILGMVKEGYLHSFSIAYKSLKSFFTMLGHIKHRVIQDLVIGNLCLTGNPINDDASFSIALKSYTKKMAEENKVAEIEKENLELKSQIETLTKEATELKSSNDDLVAGKEKEISELKSELAKADEGNTEDDKADGEAELKSMSEKMTSMETEIAELKSVLEAPQIKSLVEIKSKDPKQTDAKVSMWDAM